MPVDLSRVPTFYHKYISLVHEQDIETSMRKHQTDLVAVLKSLPAEKWDYRYAPGKWTVKDLIQHVIDAERIFCYRALRFARNDRTELPGFDENSFAVAADASHRSSHDLITELATVQLSSAQLFQSFSDEHLDMTGIANGNSVYVKAIGFIIVGHTRHHKNIILERYM